MSTNEELKKVRDIVQSFQKSKKILRMYPQNNPVYINTLEDNFAKFKDFFYYMDDLNLKIRQNELLYENEQVYYSPEKEDNLALFFFKDGLREITFKKGLTFEEMEDFLRIISLDFNREALDDDIVTLFWERDFQNVHHVVDEAVLVEDDDYEAKAMAELEEKKEDQDELLKAYEDAFREDEVVKDVFIVPLSDKDLQQLVKDLEKDSLDKTGKLIDILFEMLYAADSKEDIDELGGFFESTIEYSVGRGDLQVTTAALGKLRQLTDDKSAPEEARKQARRALVFACGERVINLMGEILDGGQEGEEKPFEDFVRLLDRNAIVPLMKILGELKSIHARKVVIDALIFLGSKDIATLAKGLNDSRWYVVRNIIYILRKIGDKRAVDYLLKTVRHEDIRVKKEVIKALSDLGGGGVLQALRDCLEDPALQVRTAAMKGLATIGSEAAKRVIMAKISEKQFKDKEFDEKKEYFEALSRWKDADTMAYLIGVVRKYTFFGRAKNFENRACAAYCLGLIGKSDALPALNKYRNDSNRLLREFVTTAIRRIEGGQ